MSKVLLWVAGLLFFFSAAALRFLPEIAQRPVFSGISLVLIAAPCIFILVRWLGSARAALVGVVLSLFAYVIEYVGLVSGFPYGSFAYSALMGPKVFGSLPLLLPVAYLPLVFGGTALSAFFVKKTFVRIVTATVFLVLFDLVLDPGAVAIGLWSFSAGGWYYGVPLTNFVGWLLSGFVSCALFFLLCNKQFVPVQLSYSAFLLLSFWTGIALFFGLWIAFVLGSLVLALLVYACRKT